MNEAVAIGLMLACIFPANGKVGSKKDHVETVVAGQSRDFLYAAESFIEDASDCTFFTVR